MKIALAYDWINQFGGAERVVKTIAGLWPGVSLFTSVYDSQKAGWAKGFSVQSSFLNRFPWASEQYRFYFLAMPLAFESFDFSSFDLVISVTSGPAKAILTRPNTFHLCYCLAPTRHLYSQDYLKVKLPFENFLRESDFIFSQRPDDYLVISKNIQQKVKKIYKREAEVIYPGVDIEKFKPNPRSGKEKYFLIVSRLVGHKRVDLAIKAFNQLGWSLKIIGTGRQEKLLRNLARQNIKFLGQVNDEVLISHYQNCQALICPQDEDFGLVQVEAQACGKPVIAFRAGGSLETIVDHKTGEFFDQQTPESLIRRLKAFRAGDYSPKDCRQNAEKFSMLQFKTKFKEVVARKWQSYKKQNS